MTDSDGSKSMTRGQRQTAAATEATVTHGAYRLRDNGLQAMTKAELLDLMQFEADLDTPQGRYQAVRRQAGLQHAMIGRLHTYIAEQAASKPLGQIKVLSSLPAFWNSYMRTVKLADDLDAGDRDELRAAELQRIRAIVDG